MQALWLAAALAAAPVDSVALPPPEVRAWQTGLVRPDRVQHAALSATLGLAAGLATERPWAGFGVAFGLGLAKEVRDRRHGGFDVVDLAADGIGAALGAWAAANLQR
jgi:hypothetical protein